MKTCRVCKRQLNLDRFTKKFSKANNSYYPDSRCKDCRAEWQREYRKNHPERYKVTNVRTVLAKYGLTLEEFDAIMVEQGGVCAVCKRPPAPGKRFAVDHNHLCCERQGSCGDCRRALLCHSCNGALGLVSDSIETLRSMIQYLEKWSQPLAV